MMPPLLHVRNGLARPADVSMLAQDSRTHFYCSYIATSIARWLAYFAMETEDYVIKIHK